MLSNEVMECISGVNERQLTDNQMFVCRTNTRGPVVSPDTHFPPLYYEEIRLLFVLSLKYKLATTPPPKQQQQQVATTANFSKGPDVHLLS